MSSAAKTQKKALGRPRELLKAAQCVRAGGIIAYPTEAVFGLGCSPRNEAAVQRLLAVKRRPSGKGLILVACCFKQLAPYCEPLPEDRWRAVLSTWPGPYTWLFPAKKTCSALLTGDHSSIAVRISAEPTVRALCRLCGHALVSTSANRSRRSPARRDADVLAEFGDEVDFVVSGCIDGDRNPTSIRDALSGKLIRA